MWVVHHDPNSFTLPESFIPERWLGDERFKNDRRDAIEPFPPGRVLYWQIVSCLQTPSLCFGK
ncbi:hypothetical protein PspLS_11520 [Pyricularia sp. CBS 133598]|nr:hypothetical protein PspLS_11520 [Pyricularia sp. CBS 133598]